MKDNIKVGSEIHAGDGGYSLGTQEKYEEFVKLRSGTMTAMEKLMYDSGLTAQGCWDQMDSYDKDAIMKLTELIVAECMDVVAKKCASPTAYNALVEHFGVEE